MAVATTSSTALAQSQTGKFDSLVSRLAERFGVSEAEVEEVFNEVHADRRSQMQENFEARLSELVEQGELTEEQKAGILDKHEEQIAFHETLKDLSPEERKAAFVAHRTEMKAWLEENGIDADIFGGPHHGIERGHKSHHFLMH